MKISERGGALIGAILAMVLVFALGCEEDKPRQYDYLKVKLISVVPDSHWFGSDYTTLYEYESGFRDTKIGIMGKEGETIVVRLWTGSHEYQLATNLSFKVK
jgi:hypothetical protein